MCGGHIPCFHEPPGNSQNDPPLVFPSCHNNPTTSSRNVSSLMIHLIPSHYPITMLQDQPPQSIQYIFISPPRLEANQLTRRHSYAVQYNYCCHHLQP